VSALAEVVNVGVDHHSSAKNGPFTRQRDHFVCDIDFGHTIFASNDVAEVPSVPLIVGGGAVGLALGVVVGPGAGAAVGVVAELVDVEPVLAGGQATDLAAQLDGISVLDKVDDTVDLFALEDAHCFGCHL